MRRLTGAVGEIPTVRKWNRAIRLAQRVDLRPHLPHGRLGPGLARGGAVEDAERHRLPWSERSKSKVEESAVVIRVGHARICAACAKVDEVTRPGVAGSADRFGIYVIPPAQGIG